MHKNSANIWVYVVVFIFRSQEKHQTAHTCVLSIPLPTVPVKFNCVPFNNGSVAHPLGCQRLSVQHQWLNSSSDFLRFVPPPKAAQHFWNAVDVPPSLRICSIVALRMRVPASLNAAHFFFPTRHFSKNNSCCKNLISEITNDVSRWKTSWLLPTYQKLTWAFRIIAPNVNPWQCSPSVLIYRTQTQPCCMFGCRRLTRFLRFFLIPGGNKLKPNQPKKNFNGATTSCGAVGFV